MKRTQAYYDKRTALAMLDDLTNPVNGLIGRKQIRKPATVAKQLREIADLIHPQTGEQK